MELIGIGFIAAGFALYLALPGWIRKRRRTEMGLPPRTKNWRDDPSVRWTDARYYSSARRRLDD